MKHELKTDPEVFKYSVAGRKKFEIRKDDRGFQRGDILILKETENSGEEMKQGKPLRYTGRTLFMIVEYILKGPVYGLQEGWVIMSGVPKEEKVSVDAA